MGDIFLSYAREDQHKAQRLAAIFRERGWDVWWDDELVPGDTWDATIQDALATSKCVVVLWSAQSVQSEWVRVEAHEAKNRNLLVPALLDSCRIPLAFTLRQTVSLKDWDGSEDHPALRRLVQAVTRKLGGAAVDRVDPLQPAKWKPWLLPLSFLLLPTLLVGCGIWYAMQWRLPTPVSITVTTTQARFKMPDIENQRRLIDQLPFQWIMVEKFAEISLAPARMEVADPSARRNSTGELSESAWHSIPLTKSSRVRLVKSGPRAIPSSAYFEPARKENHPLGVLESVLTESGMEVGLRVQGGDSQTTLTVELTGPQAEAKLLATKPVVLYVRESRFEDLESLQVEGRDNQTFRIRLQEMDSKLKVSGSTRPHSGSVSQLEPAKVRTPAIVEILTLTLGLGQDPQAAVLSQDAIPIAGIDFSYLDEETKRRVAPRVFEGKLKFGPGYTGQETIEFKSPDFLRIEPEKNPEQILVIKHMRVDRGKKGLEFLMEGRASVLVTGTVGAPGRDHRITAWEWLKASQAATLFGGMTWFLLTLLGVFKAWKELRPDA